MYATPRLPLMEIITYAFVSAFENLPRDCYLPRSVLSSIIIVSVKPSALQNHPLMKF